MAGHPEKYDSGGVPIPVEVFEPTTPPPHPAVLIVHGSAGLGPQFRPDIVSFADALAGAGIVAMLPHYFVSAGMRADDNGLPLIERHLPTWLKACHDALVFMSRDARCNASKLGVLGFSFGAHLTLRLGMDPPAGIVPRALVDFFGPTVSVPLDGPWARMPPLLIQHGDDDHLVPPSESQHLIAKLKGAGKRETHDFEVRWYKGQGHVFDSTSLTEARKVTIEFFGHRL